MGVQACYSGLGIKFGGILPILINMKPFFSYYGSKWRSSKHYSKPNKKLVIEPFAGSASYSVWYDCEDVLLYDVNPVIVGVWEYLIRSSEKDIMDLPSVVNHVDELVVCQEAKWLIGFWLNKASAGPRKQPGSWMRSGINNSSYWGEQIKIRIASQLSKIRGWKIFLGSYEGIDNYDATWFIDPPYNNRAGRIYTYRDIDYNKLGEWCMGRIGQVIVCEQQGASWLPFREFGKFKSAGRSFNKDVYSHEVVWTNEK